MNEKNEGDPPLETKPLNDETPNFEKKTFMQKLRYVKKNITVEPILAGLVIPSMLSRLAIQNLNLDKACRVRLDYGEEVCNALISRNGTNLTEYEREVQKVITAIEAWKSIIQTALPMFLIVFMGAWSDRTGNRKICILMPLFGEFLTCISNILSAYFFYEIPVEATMILEGVFIAAAGGWVMLLLGVFSYISDVTSEDTRTFRVGLANLCLTGGIPIGTALSGILLKQLGYYGVFALSGIIYLITFLYGVFYLESMTKRCDGRVQTEGKFMATDAVKLVKETSTVAFKKRPNNQRIKIILTLLTVAAIYGPNHGERSVIYLYLRYKLKWDAMRYSIYSTYSIITHSIGALFSITVFSKRLGFPDALLCLISVTSKCVGSIMIAFVSTDFEMFMVPLVEILNATTFTSLRSMASKLVSSEELGKMNSLFSLVETLAALVFDPTYSVIYLATIKPMAGAIFLFSATTTVPAGIILVWFLIQYYGKEKKMRQTEGTNEKDAIEKSEKENLKQKE